MTAQPFDLTLLAHLDGRRVGLVAVAPSWAVDVAQAGGTPVVVDTGGLSALPRASLDVLVIQDVQPAQAARVLAPGGVLLVLIPRGALRRVRRALVSAGFGHVAAHGVEPAERLTTLVSLADPSASRAWFGSLRPALSRRDLIVRPSARVAVALRLSPLLYPRLLVTARRAA